MVHILEHEDPILFVPGPSKLIPAARAALARHVGHRCPEFRKMFRSTVEYLREVFDTEGEVHIFTASGTGAVEAAVANFITRDDKVLVLNFGTFGRRFREQIERKCRNVIEYKVEYGLVPSPDKVRAFLEQNKIKELDVVVTVFNETNPGTVLRERVRDFAKLAHDYGAIIIVDNVSGLGGDYFSCSRWSIDVALSSSQKCLGAPPGLSFLTLRTYEAEKKLNKTTSESTYFDIKISRKFLQKNETPFTPAVNVLAALHAALKYILENVGLATWIRWHYERANIIIKALTMLGLEPFVKQEDVRSVTVLSFKYPSQIIAKTLRNELYKKVGIDIADGMDELRGKIFRIGNMGWITRRDLMLLISSIGAVLCEYNKEISASLGEAIREVFSCYLSIA